ncbi:MAG: sel1 repeat family protein, partial [Desulfobulbaceae bacterium]|nr:sel1 repeat family protein [Desulfobulbaceae bacterium]
KQNHEKARIWFRNAAEQGYHPAQLNLGLMYENGYAIKRDLEKAEHWYKKAAEQGSVQAAEALKRLAGKGTP